MADTWSQNTESTPLVRQSPDLALDADYKWLPRPWYLAVNSLASCHNIGHPLDNPSPSLRTIPTMADSSGAKRPAIPNWQRSPIQSSTTAEPPPSDYTSPSDNMRRSDTELLEQAKRWLEDESIRDAPTERKASFLEQKGLQGSDIQKLLRTDHGLQHDNASSPSNTQAASPTSSDIPTKASTPITSPRDVPPIITYPDSRETSSTRHLSAPSIRCLRLCQSHSSHIWREQIPSAAYA
jgi:hypothetical protein